MEEDVLVDVVRDLDELGVVLGAELHDGDLAALAEGLDELAVELLPALLAEGELQAGVVEGDRHERAVDVGEHLVLVVGPLGEAGQEVVHALVEGVVDMRAVLVDQDAVPVIAVVGVARDVVAPLEHGDTEPGGLRQATGAHRAREPGPHDDHVV